VNGDMADSDIVIIGVDVEDMVVLVEDLVVVTSTTTVVIGSIIFKIGMELALSMVKELKFDFVILRFKKSWPAF